MDYIIGNMETETLLSKIREIRCDLYNCGEFHFAECLDRAVAFIGNCSVECPEAGIAVLNCLERIEAHFHSLYDKGNGEVVAATNSEICKLILAKNPEYGMPVNKQK
jgi:hypothetical protein